MSSEFPFMSEGVVEGSALAWVEDVSIGEMISTDDVGIRAVSLQLRTNQGVSSFAMAPQDAVLFGQTLTDAGFNAAD